MCIRDRISSFDLAKDTTILKGKRMFGQLIASKFPISAIDPEKINVPWQERVLSVKLQNNIYLHTTHIPPGSSNGWIKVKMIDGLVKYLIKNSIEAKIHYPKPLHLQKAAKVLKHQIGSFPNAEMQAKKLLTLPVHQYSAFLYSLAHKHLTHHIQGRQLKCIQYLHFL